MPQSLTLDDLDALTRSTAPPPAAAPVARPRPVAPTARALTLDDLDALTKSAAAAKPAAPTQASESSWTTDDPTKQNVLRSFYDEGIAPFVDLAKRAASSDDLGVSLAKQMVSGLANDAYHFATHPDLRNFPIVGTGFTAAAEKAQRQYNAGNAQGAVGTIFGSIAPYLLAEFGPGLFAKLPAAMKTAAMAADTAGAFGEAAGAGLKAGVKAAAPDLTMAAKIGAPAIIAQRLAPGGAAGLIEGGADIVSAAQAARGVYRGAKAARAAYQGVRAAQATAAEVADAVAARAAEGPRVPIWQQGYEDAAAARAAEAARPPTDPLWQDARAAGAAAAEQPPSEQPPGAPPEAPPAAETAAPAEAAPEAPAAPARTPAQKLEDWIDEHTAYRRMQAQDLEWGNRARMADRYAEYFINNKLDPTPENIARATRDMGEDRIPGGDETMPMIQERVAWHNARAAAAEAAPAEVAAQHEATARALPPAGATVDGLEVHHDIPNTDSIHSSIENPEELPGVREIPMSLFSGAGTPGDANFSYSATENTRTLKLAKDIERNGHIKPLIVAFDKEGPYIVEGGHRFDALGYLGKKSFPAKVVLDTDSLDAAAPPAKPPAAVNPLTAAPAEVGAANASEVGAAPTAPEAKSLTEQQLEASIAAVKPKRAAAEARASAAEAPKPAAQASDAPEMQSLALAKHWVDSLQAHGLTTEEGARTVEMISRRTVMSDAEVSDLVKAATKNGTVKATGQDIAAAYHAQYPPETREGRRALELARLDNMINPAVKLVNSEGVDRMAKAIKQNGAPPAEAPAAALSGNMKDGPYADLKQAHEMTSREFIDNKRTKAQMIAEGAEGSLSRAVLQAIPVKKIVGLEPTPAMEGGYKPGTPITQPIEVEYNPADDTYTLYSGNHRVTQAELNGQRTIPAYVEGDPIHAKIVKRNAPRPRKQ